MMRKHFWGALSCYGVLRWRKLTFCVVFNIRMYWYYLHLWHILSAAHWEPTRSVSRLPGLCLPNKIGPNTEQIGFFNLCKTGPTLCLFTLTAVAFHADRPIVQYFPTRTNKGSCLSDMSTYKTPGSSPCMSSTHISTNTFVFSQIKPSSALGLSSLVHCLRCMRHKKSFPATLQIRTVNLSSDSLTAGCYKLPPKITTCTGPSPHCYPSLCVCLSLPLHPNPPPLPPLLHHSITQEAWSSWKQALELGKGTRLRGVGTWWGGRGCFCRFSVSLVTAGLTVVHPEETRLTSFWPGLGPTHAACSWGGCDKLTSALQQLLTHGRHKVKHGPKTLLFEPFGS